MDNHADGAFGHFVGKTDMFRVCYHRSSSVHEEEQQQEQQDPNGAGAGTGPKISNGVRAVRGPHKILQEASPKMRRAHTEGRIRASKQNAQLTAVPVGVRRELARKAKLAKQLLQAKVQASPSKPRGRFLERMVGGRGDSPALKSSHLRPRSGSPRRTKAHFHDGRDRDGDEHEIAEFTDSARKRSLSFSLKLTETAMTEAPQARAPVYVDEFDKIKDMRDLQTIEQFPMLKVGNVYELERMKLEYWATCDLAMQRCAYVEKRSRPAKGNGVKPSEVYNRESKPIGDDTARSAIYATRVKDTSKFYLDKLEMPTFKTQEERLQFPGFKSNIPLKYMRTPAMTELVLNHKGTSKDLCGAMTELAKRFTAGTLSSRGVKDVVSNAKSCIRVQRRVHDSVE